MHGFLPETLPLHVLANRPDVQEAEAQLRAANEAVGATSSTLLPALSISNYLGQGSAIKGTVSLSQAAFSMPIINLPLYAQIKGNKALYQAALTHYIDIIKRSLKDIENDFSAYHIYTNQYKRHKQAYQHQKKHCQLTTQRHKHGLESKATVLQCHIQLAQLKLLVNQSKLEYLLVIVRLYRDLAGGYRDG
jgi:outer membrane protein TolC